MTSTMAAACEITTCEKEAYQIGLEAYLYFYPLLSMDFTRKQCTNIEAGKRPGFGPVNSFSHIRAYPDADFKAVVRPNFDTLYSSAWIDVSEEPVVISVPEIKDRYYLLPMLDMWTDVFAVPGSRTTGSGAMKFAIVSRNWKGTLPDGVERIEAPTDWVWMIGRTKTDGPDDYAAVHKVQDALSLVLLSEFGKTAKERVAKIDSAIDMKTPPLEQVNALSAKDYFSHAAELLKQFPPHATDYSQMARLAKLGIEQGKNFDLNKLDKACQSALEKAKSDALKMMVDKAKTVGRVVNGWVINTDSMGVYGNAYLKRAIVSMIGLGANQPEDAVYPLNLADADGKPLDGNNNYVLHFEQSELPPVDGFWSLTMYDKDGFQSANSINRFAISSWMPLKKNADGSLDLYLQNSNPGGDKESNWLPAPKGQLGVTLRLYAPKMEVLNASWNPPAIKRV